MDENEARNGMTNKRIDLHECAQEKVLTTICVKLENIEKDILDIKQGQMIFMQGLREREIKAAKYPEPDFVNKSIAKIDRHELYFKIIWVVLGFAWVALLFLLDKLWK